MEKIIQFIKSYKVWILIGAILGILVTVILFNILKEREGDTKLEKIQNPFFTQTIDLDIDLKNIQEEIPSSDKVFKVTGNINSKFTSFLNTFHTYSNKIDFSKEIYLTLEKDTFSYSPKTRILMIDSQPGLTLWFKITSESDLETFFEEYFDIESITIVETKNIGNNTEYSGSYVFKKVEMGSVYLDGNAFSVEVNSKGDIVNLSMLLLNSSNIVEYQLMPLSDIETLIGDSRYPKMVFYTEIEERYYEQSPLFASSGVLTDFVVTEMSKIYTFIDSSNGFVVPTYKLIGDGRLKNSRDEKYLAKVNIFLCAINPAYLIERELEKGETFSDPVSPVDL
ncbi:MAG: hypothetical protein UR61_C0050G0002 [candidate division WS6 bacterium GW2011_GWE1_34_7]|uniref:Uncharacterized protein n=1 Tax=candidate division WS6 bacterium GW2011_GWE1_34_7 TaxID=1619093 RepID=A0A0G0BKS7_9BACT|nr:MAG: hypothetical protein UR61_C0050G0002 [candidate division WS6 bacterium GW2011_GWE1_34_7]